MLDLSQRRSIVVRPSEASNNCVHVSAEQRGVCAAKALQCDAAGDVPFGVASVVPSERRGDNSDIWFTGNEKEVPLMPRKAGERYRCEKCGAVLVYEKECPCPDATQHSEICCGVQMKRIEDKAPAGK